MPRLDTADDIRLGAAAVDAVYRGAELIWPVAAVDLPYVGPAEDFSGTLAAWGNSYNTVSIVNGRGRTPCRALPGGEPDYAGIETTGAGSRAFAGRYLLVEVPEVPAASTAVADAVAQVWLFSAATNTATPGARIGFSYNAVTGLLSFDDQVGYTDPGRVSVTYSATDHRWWRIGHTGTAVQWATSPSGYGTWTVQRTLATPPAWSTNTDTAVALEAWRDAGAEDFAEFDNVNITPVAPVGGFGLAPFGTSPFGGSA